MIYNDSKTNKFYPSQWHHGKTITMRKGITPENVMNSMRPKSYVTENIDCKMNEQLTATEIKELKKYSNNI